MKKTGFWTFYGILIGAIVLLVNYVVVYVQKSINTYEASQPEHMVEAVLDEFSVMAAQNRADELLSYPEIELSIYDPTEDVQTLFTDYREKVRNVSNWTYRTLSGSYSEEKSSYGFYGDGELLACLTLLSNDSQIVMDILTVNDWAEGTITPKVMVTTYTVVVEIPESFTPIVNGMYVDDDYGNVTIKKVNGKCVYTISNLFALPDVKVLDRKGEVIPCSNDNGYVTVDTTSYHLLLPMYFTLYENGELVSGMTTANGVEYDFDSIYDSLMIRDEHGQELEYRNGDSVFVRDVVVSVPSNYKVTFLGEDASSYQTDREEIRKYRYCSEYVEMPELVTYTFKRAVASTGITIFDNLGNEVAPDFSNNSFVVTEQAPVSKLPEKISAEIDPLAVVKLWSDYLTDDLSGKNHGFDTMKKYLLTDSYIYDVAYKWSKNIDITFVNAHETPEFTDAQISNPVIFSDKLFSVDAYVEKTFVVTQNKEFITHKINSTFYFYKSDGKWVLIDMADILKTDSSGENDFE